MKRVGVIGLGNMGSGLAKNLIEAGFETWGLDLCEERMAALEAMGGKPATSARALGEVAEAVFVMVLDGKQARAVILGADGLVQSMGAGGVVILTATIGSSEARAIGRDLEGSGIEFVDSPVSGGLAGAQAGTLNLMAAAKPGTFEACRDVLGAVSKKIIHVGEEPGQGQTVKACLQALLGTIFAATLESAVLAAKSGISGKVLHEVFSVTGPPDGLHSSVLRKVLDRAFVGTGAHISTMHKDLTIALDLGRESGVPLFATAAAMQLFQCGIAKHPEGDNWIVAKVLEDIAGAEARW